MKTKTLFLELLILLFMVPRSWGQDYRFLSNSESSAITASGGIDSPVTIKVIYDNYIKVEGFMEDWGYSIYIDGLEKKILFDTGTKPEIFESNFKRTGIDAGKIDFLVLSHEHYDHTGGIPVFVSMKTGIPVLIPHSFSEQFKKRMTGLGLEPLLVKEPAQICKHLWSSGEFEYVIPEQALVLDTRKGLFVMTGCSHPGIITMLRKIKSDFKKDIYMVFGGFHLMQKSDNEMNEIITEMKALGVTKCGATHCTGDRQIKLIREAFGENFIELGAGNTLVIN